MTEIYDPQRLIQDVIKLLESRGIHSYLAPGKLGEAMAGAGTLLRALDVRPGLDTVDAFERSAAKVWSDSD